ncbi:MAG TPA: PA14 domain-containing protein [Verrucomicrobiota bacterium]|nr:PA14 domain-containing protein [Verrucomicrobiota bacterium]
MKIIQSIPLRPTLRGLVLALAVTALSSFVARAVPYASGVVKSGDTVTFILNQPAQSLVVLTNGVPMAHSIDSSTAGQKSFDMPGATTFSIIVSNDVPKAWTQYVTDGPDRNFYTPLGVAVNKNPASANFGQVFVCNVTNATTAAGRATSDGIYVLRADGVAAGFGTGGVTWTGSLSPFKSTVGPDGHLYVADLSNDLCYELSPDLSSAVQLIDASNKSSGQYVNSLVVEGTQAAGNRKIYLVNGNYNDTARKGLICYDLGASATATANDKGTQVIGPTAWSGFYPYDVARDLNGDWYLNTYRSETNQAPPIIKFRGAGVWPLEDDVIWSASRWYAGGPFGIDVFDKAGLVAYTTYNTGFIRFFDMDTGNFVEEFDAGTRGRELAFDAAGNLITVDSSVEYARFWSPGGKTVAITSFDGTTTSFNLWPPTVYAATTQSTATEGGAPGVFTLTRDGDLSSPLTVNYALSGTATNGGDYTNLTGSVVIPASAATAQVYVQAVGDAESEPTETVILTLAASTDYKARGTPLLYISDTNTPVLTVTISPSIYERVADDYATITISRSLGNTNVVTFLQDSTVFTFAGTAVKGMDYSVIDYFDFPVTFELGERTKTVRLLAPVDTTLLDGPRTVVVGLPDGVDYMGRAWLGTTNPATTTVIDDEDPAETVLWSDNFNVDSSANYTVKFGSQKSLLDYTSEFAYNYTANGVPAAPHSTSDTLGLRLNVNKNNYTNAAGLNLYPNNQSFSGNYALRFDMYLFNGTLASTEFPMFGLNHSGTKTNWSRLNNFGYTNSSYDGLWATVASDGAEAYRLLTGPATTTGIIRPTYRATAAVSTLAQVFKSPPFDVAGSPANEDLSGTPVWADVELSQVGTLVTLRINHTTVLQYNNTVAETSGNIMLGYNDAYDSVGNSLGVIYDNVRVVQIYPPTIVTQPASTVVPAGGTANFSVVASGSTTGFTNYQWQFNGVAIPGATGSSLTLNNVQLANYGAYSVVVSDGVYSVTSDTANLLVLPAGVALGSGTGLKAGYWTAHTSTAPYTGSPTLTRTDSAVNLDWVTGSPDASISADTFTARWVGQIQALSSGTDTYTFTTLSDDGVRVWVDGQLVVDSWIPQSATIPRTGTIALTGTNKYDLLVEYYEATGNASVRLYWSNPATVGYSIVPQSQLYPADGVLPAVSLTAPANGSSYMAPATINLAANVTATNKNLIQYVSFYNGAALIGSVTNAPYQYSWTGVPGGTYNLTAALVYNTNWMVFSAETNTVTVAALIGPTISGITGNTLNYSGGSGSQFVLLSTNNIVAPLANWTRVDTNANPSGSFTIPVGSEARAFYTIQAE